MGLFEVFVPFGRVHLGIYSVNENYSKLYAFSSIRTHLSTSRRFMARGSYTLRSKLSIQTSLFSAYTYNILISDI